MEIGIYEIKNIKNGKKYIGSSKEMEKRFKRHINELNKNKHHNKYLQRAWNKYGTDSFEFNIIYLCDEESLLMVEQLYLDEIFNMDSPEKLYYNIGTSAVGGDNISKNPNRETIILNISNGVKNMYSKMSTKEREELCINMSGENNPNYGNKWTDESKEKLSNDLKNYYENNDNYIKNKTWVEYHGLEKATILKNKLSLIASERVGDKNGFYGKKHTDYIKNIISICNKGKITKNNLKPFEIDNKLYLTLNEASIKLNIHPTTIRHRLISSNIKFDSYKYIIDENIIIQLFETNKDILK